MKQEITIYGKNNCPWCEKACDYIDFLGLEYYYINVYKDISPEALMRLKKDYDIKTVPAIFINGEFIGGYTELVQNLYLL